MLSLLHGLAATVDDDIARLALSRAGRHYYDVYKLLGHEPTIAACARIGFVEALADDIGMHSRRNGWPCSPRPDGGFARSPAFDPTHTAYDVAQVAYSRVAGLVYGEVPTFEACVARVHTNADSL
jgi:hypothetical protein